MTMGIDWQEIANDLSEGIRELHTALDNYNAAFDRADEARKAISDDELLEGFSDEWNEVEGGVMAVEDQLRDLAKLTDFIEEKLV